MIGTILALALSQPVTCTVVSLAPLSVVCGQVELRDIEWPQEWKGGAFLTGEYMAEIVDGKILPVFTPENKERTRRVYERSLAEGRRWRRTAAQQLKLHGDR